MSWEVVRWPGILEQREQREQQQDDDHPEGEVAQIGVHPVSFAVGGRQRPVSPGILAGKLRGRFTCRPGYNLGAGRAPAKGTSCNFLPFYCRLGPVARGHIWPWLRRLTAQRLSAPRPGRARPTSSVPLEGDQRARQACGAAERCLARRLAAPQRLAERLELAEFDRPSSPAACDRAAEQAQGDLRRQAGELLGVEHDRPAIGPRQLRQRRAPRASTAVSIAASARRSRRASSASGARRAPRARAPASARAAARG